MDTRLGQLERDFAAMSKIADRMDTTIEKLAEVSSNVSRLLAVQDKRLEMQERSVDRLEALVENRRVEVELRFDKFSNLLGHTETIFKTELNKNHEKLSTQLDTMQDDYKEISEKFDKRITALERWMWVLGGAGAIIGFLINSIIGIL